MFLWRSFLYLISGVLILGGSFWDLKAQAKKVEDPYPPFFVGISPSMLAYRTETGKSWDTYAATIWAGRSLGAGLEFATRISYSPAANYAGLGEKLELWDMSYNLRIKLNNGGMIPVYARFAPFLNVGIGGNYVKNHPDAYTPVGIGANIRISPKTFAQLSLNRNISLNRLPQYNQFSVGFGYRFGKKKQLIAEDLLPEPIQWLTISCGDSAFYACDSSPRITPSHTLSPKRTLTLEEWRSDSLAYIYRLATSKNTSPENISVKTLDSLTQLAAKIPLMKITLPPNKAAYTIIMPHKAGSPSKDSLIQTPAPTDSVKKELPKEVAIQKIDSIKVVTPKESALPIVDTTARKPEKVLLFPDSPSHFYSFSGELDSDKPKAKLDSLPKKAKIEPKISLKDSLAQNITAPKTAQIAANTPSHLSCQMVSQRLAPPIILHFDSTQTVLDSLSKQTLAETVTALSACTSTLYILFWDKKESNEAEKTLLTARNKAAMEFLISKGIPAKKVLVSSRKYPETYKESLGNLEEKGNIILIVR